MLKSAFAAPKSLLALLTFTLLFAGFHPALAQDEPVSLTFTTSPGIVKQGKDIEVTVGLKNNTVQLQTVWLNISLKEVAIPLYNSGPIGPIPLLPFFNFSTNQTVKLPKSLLPGAYTIQVSVGPSKMDSSSFDSVSQSLIVLINLPGPLRLPAQK